MGNVEGTNMEHETYGVKGASEKIWEHVCNMNNGIGLWKKIAYAPREGNGVFN